MEFRTDVPGEEKDDNSGGVESDLIDNALQQAKKQLAKDPQKRVQLARGLQENYGIDPQLTALFVPGLEEDIQKAQNEQENQEAHKPNKQDTNMERSQAAQSVEAIPANTAKEAQEQNMPEVNNQMTPDDILKVVEGMIDTLGEDTTLGELKTLVKNNPDLVEREIDEYL